LSWLRIELYAILLFALYEVIMVSWPRFNKLIQVDLSNFYLLFYFNHSVLGWLGIELYNFIYLFSIGLSRFYDSGTELDLLTWVFLFFLIDFF
jgi:hypothetical protein